MMKGTGFQFLELEKLMGAYIETCISMCFSLREEGWKRNTKQSKKNTLIPKQILKRKVLNPVQCHVAASCIDSTFVA